MKAISKVAPQPGAILTDLPVPNPKDDEVLIKVLATSICGTDLHIYNWDAWAQNRIIPPRIFGHEIVGEVVEVGKKVTNVKIGDYVAAESHIACNNCYLCKIGNAHLCLNLKILGVDIDGSFAEYLVLKAENAWKTDRSIPKEIACLQEPLGNAIYAALVEEVNDKRIAVFGCGPIGLMSIAVLKASGASKIFAVEPDPGRLELAQRMGTTNLINPQELDPVSFIKEQTEGVGCDVLLEMSGSPIALEQGLKSLRKAGRASFFGIANDKIALDISELIIFKGITIYGINGRKMFQTWYQMEELLPKLDLLPIITHKLPLLQFKTAMELLALKKAAKIVLYP